MGPSLTGQKVVLEDRWPPAVRFEPFDFPFVLRFSQDEREAQDGSVKGSRSWFDRLTTNGCYPMRLFT
jgi:hypothetical protein